MSGTDVQSILNNALSQLKSIESSGSATGGSSSNTQFINSIYSLVGDAETLSEGGNQQTASAVGGIVKNVINAILSLGTGERDKANQEVKTNTENANTLGQNAETTFQNTNQQVTEIMNSITENTSALESAMEQIQALGGDQGVIAEAQAQLEEQLTIIEEQKNILNSSDSTPQEKEAALNSINNASVEIAGLVESIGTYQAEIETQNAAVETATTNVSGLIEQSVSTIADGAAKLQAYMQQGAAQITTNTTSSVTGTGNTVTGQSATAAGNAAGSNVFTASIAPKLLRIGADQSGAGTIRLGGAVSNLSALTKAIGEMGSDLTEMANFVNSVGGIGENFLNLVGQYGETLEPVIVAVGSWDAVADANEQLQTAITDYSAASGIAVQSSDETSASQGQNKAPASAPQAPAEGGQVQNTGDVKFEFDTNLFRMGFESQGA